MSYLRTISSSQDEICPKNFDAFFLIYTESDIDIIYNNKVEQFGRGDLILIDAKSGFECRYADKKRVHIVVIPHVLLSGYSEKRIRKNIFAGADMVKKCCDLIQSLSYSNVDSFAIKFQKVLAIMKGEGGEQKPVSDFEVINNMIITTASDPEFTIQELSKRVGFSRAKIQYVLARENTTYSKQLVLARVELLKYKLLLSAKSVSLDTLIKECGYIHVRSAYRHFRMLLNVAPVEFRKKGTKLLSEILVV
ncbi:helix-turn-helix domain-containing protein [Photobacterium damselae]|uniref:helix-turn-helix domain-containing protein n=1 Tax=Photobacterium damselae TaxID=38293 RepID=UPI004067BF70